MLRFDHSKFSIPPFEKVEIRPSDEESEVEKAERVFRALASQVPAGLDEERVTPARLSWVVLWSRITNLGIAAAGTLAADDRYTTEILYRASEEVDLHIKAIITPIVEVKVGSEQYWKGVNDRLQGFLVWCLKSDQEFFEKAGSRTYMDLIWDPQPVLDIVKDPNSAALHDFIGTKLEILNEHEIEMERSKSETHIREKVGELKALLRDPRIRDWSARYEELRRDGKTPTFFSLITQRHTSLSAEFREIGIKLANLNYSMASSLLHGQTALQFIESVDDAVLPAIGAFDRDKLEAKAQNIFGACSMSLATLSVIKHHCLELKGP